MTLTRKILLTVTITFVLTMTLLGAIATRVVLDRFKSLENDVATRDVLRVRYALEDELAGLSATCGDWAPWDDTRDFILGLAPDYVESNLDLATVLNLNLTFMAFFDTDRQIAHFHYISLEEEMEAEPPAGLVETLQETPELFQHPELGAARSGILLVGSTPYLVATCAITDNDRTPPANGTLVVGREFSPFQIRQLAEKTQADLNFFVSDDPGLPPEVRDVWSEIADTDLIRIIPANPDTLAGYASIQDFTGKPAMAMRVLFPRAILNQGIATARTFVLLILVVGALTMVTLMFILKRIAIDPIVRLREHVRVIGETKDLSRQFSTGSSDEVGKLAESFNAMATNLNQAQTELKETHQKLVVTARQAGMAEVASGVLHNVGNVLNSVNTCVSLLRRQLGESRIENLGRTLDLMEAHEGDLAEFLTHSDQGQKVLPYLRGLSARLVEERSEAAQIVENLTKHIQHIIEIISMQQSVAKTIGVIEDVDLNELIDNAVNICADSLNRHHIKLKVERAELPSIRLDRHQVLQILVNLLSNAKHAVSEASGADGKQIWLRVFTPDPETVRIEVSDNGVGISQENLTRIFSHGFTTRHDGHGFGLHSAALAAKQLNGALEAFSDGPKQGATFSLTLPLRTNGGEARDRE